MEPPPSQAIATGCASGTGRATTARLAAEGWTVKVEPAVAAVVALDAG